MMEVNKIYLGDCYELIDLIDCDKVCIVTDPPFNIGYHYNEYKDKLNEEKYYDWLKSILTKKNIPFVIIHYPEALYKLSIKLGLSPERVISWVYNSNTPRQHRDIAFFKVKPDFSSVKQPYKNTNDKRIMERIKNGFDGANIYDWWEVNQVKNVNDEKYKHPCQMPLEVMKNIIAMIPEGYIILDPFIGSGTTAVACKELGRNYIGFEIDKDYFKIAVDRLNGIKPNGQTSIFTDFEQLNLLED